MMKRLNSWLMSGTYALALVIAATPQVEARPTHGGAATSPNGCNLLFSDNGCSGSPGGNFEVNNFFTGYTGTTYPARPTYNVAGVDYKVGMPAISNPAWTGTINGVMLAGACGMDAMQDPATATTSPSSDNPGCGIIPQHCSYGVNTSLTEIPRPYFACTNTANNIVVKGFNFDAVGGHNATRLNFCESNSVGDPCPNAGAFTGNMTIAFNNFAGDVATYTYGSVLSSATGLPGNAVAYANNFYGHWLDSFSAFGLGTGSFASNGVMTITACTSCNFKPGQAIGSDTMTQANDVIRSQLTGTGGATCPDPTCNGGVGSYQTTSTMAAASSPNTQSAFFLGGGQLNANGGVQFLYNAITQWNGRLVTAQMRCGSCTNPTINLVENSYNYFEGGIYKAVCSTGNPICQHWEMVEWVLGTGAESSPIVFTNVHGYGNTFYQDGNIVATSTTSAFFVNTGAVGGPVGPSYTLTYANTDLSNNVMVQNTSVAGSASLLTTCGSYSTNFTANNNWVAKGTSASFASCNGVPTIGGVLQVAFPTAAQAGTTFNAGFSSGIPIVAGQHIYETKSYISSQNTSVVSAANFTGQIGFTTTGTTVSGTPTQIDLTSVSGFITVGNAGTGDIVTGTGIPANTHLQSQISGTTGGAGRYATAASNNSAVSTTAASAAITGASNVLLVDSGSVAGVIAINETLGASGLAATSVFSGSGLSWIISGITATIAPGTAFTASGGASFNAAASGTTLNITPGSIVGTVAVGQYFNGSGIPSGTTIVSGSSNTWTLSQSAGTIAAIAMTSGPGGLAGSYVASTPVTLSSRGMRTAPDAITNIISVSGNTDLLAGTALTLQQFLAHGTLGGANPGMYPGFQ